MNTLEFEYILKPTFYCRQCDKKYRRKTSFERHKIVCDVLSLTPKERKCAEEEEWGDLLPTTTDIRKLVVEMFYKQRNMEKELTQMKKEIVKTKKKINILDWLRDNRKSAVIFEDWLPQIVVTADHLEVLIGKSFVACLESILDSQSLPLASFPICFYSNTFYKFDEDSSGWRVWEKSEIVIWLDKWQRKLLLELKEWKAKRKDEWSQNEKCVEKYNTAISHLMISLKNDFIVNKCKSIIASHCELEKLHIVEYELE